MYMNVNYEITLKLLALPQDNYIPQLLYGHKIRVVADLNLLTNRVFGKIAKM